ncbi:dehydrodolichyl diphosphate synthase subunit [Rhynchophorus ferrugineus]|uniref:dehydrodolichyl diphosphate synthase subunit n=1 Tax=Rhynchophorus ferrugineus TaxID=354439 RepID=UPI003FCD0847
MPWIAENSLTPVQRFCSNILACGPVPRHIAFIMDGNRRYAKKKQIDKAVGHSRGFEKLSECLRWCLELNIKEVTVYAFSIENFKRSKEEVDALMELARSKFTKLFEEKDKLMENGICIRVIGNLSLLPEDIRKLIAKAMILTKDNNKAILNVAFAYTSREEMTHSIQTIVEGVKNGDIVKEDIDEDLISNCLYTNLSPNPDLLIRTSGEVRLSDFLLWQISNTQVYFTEVLWPEFSIWHLLAAIFKYQRQYNAMVTFEKDRFKPKCSENARVESFLNNLQLKRLRQLEIYAGM